MRASGVAQLTYSLAKGLMLSKLSLSWLTTLHRTHHSNLCFSKILITSWHEWLGNNYSLQCLITDGQSHPLYGYLKLALIMWCFVWRTSKWDFDMDHTCTDTHKAVWSHGLYHSLTCSFIYSLFYPSNHYSWH